MNELYEHQKIALRKLSNGKILWGGVGSGKTRVAVEYYKLREAPRDVYVITTARKRDSLDWEKEFVDVGIGARTGPTTASDRGNKKARSDDSGGHGESAARIDAVASGSVGVEQEISGDEYPDRANTGRASGRLGTLGPGRDEQNGGDTADGGSLSPRSSDRDGGSRRGRAGSDDQLQNESLVGQPERYPSDDSATRGNPVGRAGEHRGAVVGRGGSSVLQGAGDDSLAGGRGEIVPVLEHESTGESQVLDRPAERRTDVLDEAGDGWTGSSGYVGLVGKAGQYPYVLTVDSWNNLAKYANVAGAFFIFDEQRLVGSGEWSRKFLRIAKHNHWIMLSATPGDTWMDYIPLFVANGFYKNRTEFKREHVVYNTFTKFPKVDRYIGVSRLARHRHDILVHMPFERHTKRRHVVVPLPYDKEMLDRVLKDRWHVYEERPLIDVGEMFLVARRVVNSDPSRLEMVCELWKNHPRLIVFYNFNYELASLRSLTEYYGVPSGISMATQEISNAVTSQKLIQPDRSKSSNQILEPSPISRNTDPYGTTSIAEWNGHRHEEVPKTDRWLYLCQYTAAAEAWNCIETDAMILYSKNYSWKVMEQAYGRIDRLNTLFKDLWYYGFTSDSFVDKAIQRSLDAKESFNVKKYRRLFEG